MSAAENAAARSIQAYFQLLADLASASAASSQIMADQITPENVFRLDAQNGLIAAAANSLSKAGELVPQAYTRYWKGLQE